MCNVMDLNGKALRGRTLFSEYLENKTGDKKSDVQPKHSPPGFCCDDHKQKTA